MDYILILIIFYFLEILHDLYQWQRFVHIHQHARARRDARDVLTDLICKFFVTAMLDGVREMRNCFFRQVDNSLAFHFPPNGDAQLVQLGFDDFIAWAAPVHVWVLVCPLPEHHTRSTDVLSGATRDDARYL